MAGRLVRELAPLARSAEGRRQARHALLGLLARETNADTAAGWAGRLGPLDPTAEDKRQARHALLGLAGGEFLRQAVRERGRHLFRATRNSPWSNRPVIGRQLRQVTPGSDERFLHDVIRARPVRAEPSDIAMQGLGVK